MSNVMSRLFHRFERHDNDQDAKRLNRELIENISARTELTRELVPELTQNRYRKHTFDLASVLSEMAVVDRDKTNA